MSMESFEDLFLDVADDDLDYDLDPKEENALLEDDEPPLSGTACDEDVLNLYIEDELLEDPPKKENLKREFPKKEAHQRINVEKRPKRLKTHERTPERLDNYRTSTSRINNSYRVSNDNNVHSEKFQHTNYTTNNYDKQSNGRQPQYHHKQGESTWSSNGPPSVPIQNQQPYVNPWLPSQPVTNVPSCHQTYSHQQTHFVDQSIYNQPHPQFYRQESYQAHEQPPQYHFNQWARPYHEEPPRLPVHQRLGTVSRDNYPPHETLEAPYHIKARPYVKTSNRVITGKPNPVHAVKIFPRSRDEVHDTRPSTRISITLKEESELKKMAEPKRAKDEIYERHGTKWVQVNAENKEEKKLQDSKRANQEIYQRNGSSWFPVKTEDNRRDVIPKQETNLRRNNNIVIKTVDLSRETKKKRPERIVTVTEMDLPLPQKSTEVVPSLLDEERVATEENGLVNTNVVVVKNLASTTTEPKIRELCRDFGAVEKLQMEMSERQAVIHFTTVASAHAFYHKFRHRMIDLSVVQTVLVPCDNNVCC